MQKYITKTDQIDAMLAEVDRQCTNAINSGQGLFIEYSIKKPEKAQTDKQRSARHVFLRQLAKELNDAGIDMKTVYAKSPEVPWSEDSMKDFWKKVLLSSKSKNSTEKQTTLDDSDIHMIMCKYFAQAHGFACPPWPSRQG